MQLKTLVENLAFSEGPRWHDGRLYYSDFYRHVVEAVDLEGNVEKIADVPTQSSGLGWLPDGRMLIVSMLDRKLLRRELDGTLVEHADLNDIATWHCNDMVVDAKGRAYVGNFGFDYDAPGATPVHADLAFVDVDGTVSVAAKGLQFPNGTVITPDGKTMIIGETFGRQLTAFDIAEDGRLGNRRCWANIDPHFPDGICLDAENGVWVADPAQNSVIRVEEGGNITHTIDPGRAAFACMLGVEDGKRLFICTADAAGGGDSRTGKIEYVDVNIPHAGRP